MINQTKFTVKKPQQPGSQQKNTASSQAHKFSDSQIHF